MRHRPFFHPARLAGLAAIGAVVLALGAAPPAAQAAYPERPVQLVVPFGAGTVVDLLGRLLAEHMAPALGVPVVVHNVPGAAGNIGVGQVARAAPDGHTLVLSGDAAIVVNPALYANLSYDPQRDLAPVSQITVTPNVLVVGPQVNARSVAELVALARAEPGRLSFASPGAGTSGHRAGELLRRAAGIELIHVPYKNSPLADVAAGTVTMFFAPTATALPLVRDGRLRALAVSSLQRLPVAPELPTLAEQGFAGFEAVAWFGLLAPAGTPAPALQRLYEAATQALAQPAVRERLAAMGAQPVGSTPAAFARLIAEETPRWAKLMREAGIKAE
ncbi:Bug family tripartite tricarboxylate transporter substrate binding protein [Pseudorhodoferax sp.]|uniref:Bug family tripartite tricarboxylate transporter substrate binding protein n=1 Tax=Pseudorhodoferax sp. TaxID=1993553 RepID=UPI002DD6B8FF|nr:tripartite tricarboxylate transporter substrate binding protein [Pseudorhodoferax sp.]